MRSRKAQTTAGGAAALVSIIGLMIILYLIFLPADARNAMLNNQGGVGGGPGGGIPGPNPGLRHLLLTQTVGRLFPPAPNEVEHTIPSFTIFTSTNAVELKRSSSMEVSRGVFGNSEGKMTFSYDSRNSASPMLSFNAKKTKGNLVVILNGEEIFNAELSSKSPPPISLPASLLGPMNELVFEAGATGAAFWRVNKHELTNVIVSAEVTDRTAATADQHFSITQGEYEVMEFGELSFLPNCDSEYTGRLRISINSQEIFSGFADCGVPNKIEIAKDLLKSGDNKLQFISEQGQYLIDLVKLTTRMSGGDVPVFYFNMPPAVYERVYFNDAWLFISIRFTDARSLKQGILNINGFETSFNVQDMVFQTQVDPGFLLPGPNSVMIMPQGAPMDIAELRVEIA